MREEKFKTLTVWVNTDCGHICADYSHLGGNVHEIAQPCCRCQPQCGGGCIAWERLRPRNGSSS